MANNRLVALNNLTSQYNEYQKLSDGTTIGVNVLEDLIKYIELELKIKYKIEPNKWKITHGAGNFDLNNYSVINYDIDNLKGEYDAHQENLDKLTKEYKSLKIKPTKSQGERLREAELNKEIYKKKFFIELNKDLSSIVKFDSIIVLDNSGKKIYFTPSKTPNKDNEEIAKLKDDKQKLDAIFKNKHYGSFDSLVIIDFYKELSTKLNKIKKLLADKDEDIKKYTIEDIYKKLYLLYDIKSVNLKGEDDKDIKEKYIQDKMSKQNTQNLLNVSQIGGASDTIDNSKIINYKFDSNENKYSFLGAQYSDLSNDYIYFKKYTHITNSEYREEPLLIKPLYRNICNNGKECEMKYVRSNRSKLKNNLATISSSARVELEKNVNNKFIFNELNIKSEKNDNDIFKFFLQNTDITLDKIKSYLKLKPIGSGYIEKFSKIISNPTDIIRGRSIIDKKSSNEFKIKLKFIINGTNKDLYIYGSKIFSRFSGFKLSFSTNDDVNVMNLNYNDYNNRYIISDSVNFKKAISELKEIIVEEMLIKTIYIDKFQNSLFENSNNEGTYVSIKIKEDDAVTSFGDSMEEITYTYFPITKKDNDTTDTYTSQKIENKWILRHDLNNDSKQIAIVCDDKFMSQFCENLKTIKLDEAEIPSIFNKNIEIEKQIIDKFNDRFKFSIYLHNNLLLNYDNSEINKREFKLNYIDSSEVNEIIIYPVDIVPIDKLSDKIKRFINDNEDFVKKIYGTLVPYVLEKICSKDVNISYDGDNNLVNLHYNNYIKIYEKFYYYPNIPTIVKKDGDTGFKQCFFIKQKKSGDDTPFTQSYMFIYYNKIDLVVGSRSQKTNRVNELFNAIAKYLLDKKLNAKSLYETLVGNITDNMTLDMLKRLKDILNKSNVGSLIKFTENDMNALFKKLDLKQLEAIIYNDWYNAITYYYSKTKEDDNIKKAESTIIKYIAALKYYNKNYTQTLEQLKTLSIEKKLDIKTEDTNLMFEYIKKENNGTNTNDEIIINETFKKFYEENNEEVNEQFKNITRREVGYTIAKYAAKIRYLYKLENNGSSDVGVQYSHISYNKLAEQNESDSSNVSFDVLKKYDKDILKLETPDTELQKMFEHIKVFDDFIIGSKWIKAFDDAYKNQKVLVEKFENIYILEGANYAVAKIVRFIYDSNNTTEDAKMTAKDFVKDLNDASDEVSLGNLKLFINGKISDLKPYYIENLFYKLNTNNQDNINIQDLIKYINRKQFSFYNVIITIAKRLKTAYGASDDGRGYIFFKNNEENMTLSILRNTLKGEWVTLSENIDNLFYILSVDEKVISLEKWQKDMKHAYEFSEEYNNFYNKIIEKLSEVKPKNEWYKYFDTDNDNLIEFDDIKNKFKELNIVFTEFEINLLWFRLTRGNLYVKENYWNILFQVQDDKSQGSNSQRTAEVATSNPVQSQAIQQISYHIFYSKDIECYILIKENSNEIITIEPLSKWKKRIDRPGNDKKKINSEGFKEKFTGGESSYEIAQKELREYNIKNLHDNHYIETGANIYYEREINMKDNLKIKIREIYNKYEESNDDKLLTKYSDDETKNLFNIYMLKDLTSDYKINIILDNKPEKYIYDQLIKNDEAKLIHIFDNNKIQNDGYRKLINEYMDNPSTLTESLDIDEKKKKEIDKELDIELDKDLKLLSADIKDEKEVSKKSYDKLVSKDHMALLKYFNRIKKFKGGADAAKPAAKPSKPTAPAAKPSKPTAPAAKPSKPTAPATKPAVQPSRPSNKLLTKVSDEEQIIKEENIIDTYKKLKEVYINIVTKYYNLVQKDGEEDDLLGEIFKDENFSNKSDESNNTNLETQCGIINKFIYEAYNKIQSVNITGFDQVQKTYSDKEKTSIEELRNTLNNALQKQLSIGVDRGKNNKLDTNTINIKLSGFKIFDNTNSKSQPISLTHHDYLKNILEKKIGASDVNILNHDARVNGAEDIIIINKLRTSKYGEADKGTIENAGLDKEDKIEFNIDIFEGKTDEEMKGKDNYNPKYKVNMDAFLKKVDDRIKKIKANNKETKQSTEDKKLSIEDKAYAKAKSRKIFQILLDELANLEKAKTIYKVNEKKIKFHIKQIQARKGEDKEGLYEDIELNDKITDIEARIKLLTDILAELPKLFIKLYRNITKLSKIPQATEYEEYVNYILKYYNIGLFDSDSDNKHKQNSIIKAIVNEKASLEELLKKKKKELETRKEDQKTNSERYLRLRERERYRDRNDRDLVYRGGYKYYGGDYDFDRNFEKIHSTFKNFIALSDNQNLTNLMKQMHENLGYLEESKKNVLGETLNNIGTNVYETIWSDYNSGILKRETLADKKYLNNFISLTEGENLHDKVDIYNLNPEKVLAINFRDKSIYIFLMFLIRTISVVTIIFLIDYNIVKTLHYSIIIYGTIYLAILASFIGVVNYDSYKFRIIFNYLNFHVNSSNILLQIVLFIIFIILVFIIVRTDDFVDNINSLLDYTQIYATLVDVADNVTNDYDDNLSESEKLKLKYRMDIVSMIVLIFTSILVLIL